MIDQLGSQGTLAITAVGILQWLKKRYDLTDSRINRALGIIAAVLATLGVGYSYDPSLGVLTITGLTLESLAKGLFLVIQQYVFQQTAWRTYKFMNGVSNGKPDFPRGGDPPENKEGTR